GVRAIEANDEAESADQQSFTSSDYGVLPNSDEQSFASSDYGDGGDGVEPNNEVQNCDITNKLSELFNHMDVHPKYEDLTDKLSKIFEKMLTVHPHNGRQQGVNQRVHASLLSEVVLIDVVPISDAGYFVIPDVPPVVPYPEQYVPISLNSRKRRPNVFIDISPRQRKRSKVTEL
ncbi:hypothetical protein THAOC_09178, partial [Thalassiosira oceanica]